MVAEVALPIPIDRTYSYAIPDRLAEAVTEGVRVRVPFGARRSTGVVVGTAAAAPSGRALKPLDDVLDDRPALTPEMLRLTRWIAEYYVCSWGEALRAALPPGIEQMRARRDWHVRLAPAYRTEDDQGTLIARLRGARQVALVRLLATVASEDVPWLRQAEAMERTGAGASTVRGLEERGVIERSEREVTRSAIEGPIMQPAELVLHPAQRAALAAIESALEAGKYTGFLLHGVTGSGKTEVYIEALKATVRAGRTGIILVPEIALTPQTVGRFRSHFGDDIAVLHSRMSLGERFDAWRHLRDGKYRIAIGPRSAALAPLTNIGLIVVDEEHETSYKQFDPAPRYHARDVAVMRAHLNDAVCVLGSATPSLESYVNAVDGKKYHLLDMPDRVPVAGFDAAPLPPVRIIDLVLERKKHQLAGALSRTLADAIQARLALGEQIILLQNRRGYAPVVTCQACGWVPECPDCSVSFTFHKPRGQLKCHYCGRTRRMPTHCAECGLDELDRLGVGTQRVEEELAERFPDARVLRMDLDTTTRKRAHHQILDKFRSGKADILLGTQMVAKGLDFPRVTLVGVVNADTGLLLPDFRAEERTFQLLTQVAGRAGRADLRGEVILQTRNADSPVLRLAAAHDYAGLVEAILPDRRTFLWPPFVRLVSVEFRGPEESTAHEVARKWTALLRKEAPDAIVLDPVPALVSRVKRQHRYRTLIKTGRGRSEEIQHAIRRTQTAYGKAPRGYKVVVDVDAVDTA